MNFFATFRTNVCPSILTIQATVGPPNITIQANV